MFKNIILYFILLSSALFYQVVFVPHQIIYLVQFSVSGMMFAVILIQGIYGQSTTIKLNFKHPIFLILTGVFLSMIIANAYHNQSYILTFWAQLYMYFYLFYFFLHILKPDIKDLEKIVLTLGILYAILFLVQYIIFPTIIFNVGAYAARETIRLYLPGGSFMGLSLFMCLDRFYKTGAVI